MKYESYSQEAQAALSYFGFLVVAWTHAEDAEAEDQNGYLTDTTWSINHGYGCLQGKIIGVATIEDWRRQEQFYGDPPAYGYQAFRKVIAE